MLHKFRGTRQGLGDPGGAHVDLLLATCAIILFVPALLGLAALWENRRSGDAQLQRALCGARLGRALVLAFVDSAWSLWLTMLVLPFGWLVARPCAHGAGGSGRPVVILVHGLYHNPAAWFVMRRRLKRAGFDQVRCYGYFSFGRDFADIAGGLARFMLRAAQDSPGGRVLLLGHSLGGLVIRAACADSRVAAGVLCRVAGVVTLGTPHRGSTLAGLLGLGRLARGLAPDGGVIRLVQALPQCPCPGLSLYTPTDAMVLPLSGALLDKRALTAGWREQALPPMSHVGLLYAGAAAEAALGFLRTCADS